jgi:uncharacterized protein YdaU (DUF1376 family)
MKNPAFQFYPADFIMGTSMMTAEETGGYIRLLCHQWAIGYIINKDNVLKQLTGVYDNDALQSIKDKFVENDDGNLINERLESIRQNYIEHQKKQSENGKKGGRPKNPKETQKKPKQKPNDNPNHNPNESSSPSSSPSSSTTSLKSIKDFENLINEKKYFQNEKIKQTFLDFIQTRIDNKKKPTEKAVDLLVKKLGKLSNKNPNLAIQLIENAIESSWQTFYPIKQNINTHNNQVQTRASINKISIHD